LSGGTAGVASLGSGGPTTTGSITGGGVGTPLTARAAFGPVRAISLPAALLPCDVERRRGGARISPCGPRYTVFVPEIGAVSGTREDVSRFRTPLRARARIPQHIVQNARDAIAAAAIPYGVQRVDAASAGPMRATARGFVVPIEVRVVYRRQGGLETRQSIVNFRLNANGQVLAAA
jgi:hypothetical protein